MLVCVFTSCRLATEKQNSVNLIFCDLNHIFPSCTLLQLLIFISLQTFASFLQSQPLHLIYSYHTSTYTRTSKMPPKYHNFPSYKIMTHTAIRFVSLPQNWNPWKYLSLLLFACRRSRSRSALSAGVRFASSSVLFLNIMWWWNG